MRSEAEVSAFLKEIMIITCGKRARTLVYSLPIKKKRDLKTNLIIKNERKLGTDYHGSKNDLKSLKKK